MGRQIDAEIGIHEENILNRHVLATSALDGPGVGCRRVAGHLVWIVNRHAFQGGIIALQRDKRTAVGGAGAGHGQQGRALVLRTGRWGAPDPDQAGLCRDHQGRVDEIITCGKKYNAAAVGGSTVKRGLDSRRIIVGAISQGAKGRIAGVDVARLKVELGLADRAVSNGRSRHGIRGQIGGGDCSIGNGRSRNRRGGEIGGGHDPLRQGG